MASPGIRRRALRSDDDDANSPGYDYANQFEIGYSRDEVLLRMAQAYEGETSLARPTRVVMTPAYAKALLNLLSEAIAHYEHDYGAVLAAGAGIASNDGNH
jgi:hypothetical protein